MSKPIIRLDEVCKNYHMGNVIVKALCGMNLEIKKGEFVAIMGPSGSGKCLHGDTMITLADGREVSIANLHKKKEKNIKAACYDFDKDKFTQSNIQEYHKRTAQIISIKTRTGKTINATLDHPLFSITDYGTCEIKAKESYNKFIAIPRKISINPKSGQRINSLSKLSKEKSIFIHNSKEILRKFAQKNRNLRSRLNNSLNIKTSTYDSWMNRSDMPLMQFFRISKLLKQDPNSFEDKIKYLKQKNTPNKIKIPLYTDHLLLEAFGYIAGDGWLDRDGVKISNTDTVLKQRIKQVFSNVFGVHSKELIKSRIDFTSTTLKHFFKNVFEVPTRQKAKNIHAPSFIYHCSNKEIAHFLRALFDCDGHMNKSKNVIEITLASEKMIKSLITLLLRFGIVAQYSITRKRATNSAMRWADYHRLCISGLENIIKYRDYIGFYSPHKEKQLHVNIEKTKKADTNVDIIPCSKLIRNTRRSLNLSIKRIKRLHKIDLDGIERTTREPTTQTVNKIIKIFEQRLDHIKDLKPSVKLRKDLGFPNTINSEKEIREYISNMIKNASKQLKELKHIYRMSKNIFWDKVRSIEKHKRQFVYDLTIKDHHNFIANNILVHNSTAVNMVGCLDIPSSGTIKLEKDNISHLSESDLAQIRGRKIGFIFQQFNLIGTLTAAENVMLPMIFQGYNKAQRMKRATELLTKVGLGDRIHHKPNELSGGQQQRVAIARSLANDPEVILADEPTGNLDSKTGKMVMQFLKKLHEEEKKTIVMVTHDSNLARYADRIEHLMDGKIV